MTETQLIDLFSRTVARKEGWEKTGKVASIAQRLNNPLNLVHWKDAKGKPYPEICGFVHFPDPESGWRAGRAQCRINIVKRRLSWREFFGGKPGVYKGFCPSRGDAKQNPTQYAREVMAMMHVDAGLDAPIIDLVSAPVTDAVVTDGAI